MKIDLTNIVPNAQYGSTELSRCMGVDRRTIDRWAATGLLKYRNRRVGAGRKYFVGADVLRCMNAYK